MKEAILYEKLDGGKVQCLSCLRKCLISQGKTGFCKTRKNIDGKLFSLYYGYFSGIRKEPLSSKPFLHFKNYSENELTLSIGGYGCNYQCKGCQNADVSRLPENIEEKAIKKTPKEIIEQAKSEKTKIIAFTWNEPAIMPEMIFDIAKSAHENGIKTVYVSNGSPTKEHIDLIAPFIDAFRYDIKAGPVVGNGFYENYCNLSVGNSVKKILETIYYTKKKGKHIELLTVLIPGYTPSCTRSVLNTALWIKENLGKETPWHMAKFFPSHELKNPTLKTPDKMLEHFSKLAMSFGLENVHVVKDKGCDCLNPKGEHVCCT